MFAALAWATLALGAPEMIPQDSTTILGTTAADFEAPLLGGGTFSLAEHRGTPVVLAFWASWCGPCRLELPALDVFQQQYPDVKIIGVNVDRERPAAERFLRQVKVEMPVAWDNEAMALGQYDVASMPTTVLVDGNGTVKLVKVGYSKEKGLVELENAVGELGR